MNSDHTGELPPIASDSDFDLKPDGDAATAATTPPNPNHVNTSTSDAAETLERSMAPDSPPPLGLVADADACHKLEHVVENAAARPVAAEQPFEPSPPSVSVRLAVLTRHSINRV